MHYDLFDNFVQKIDQLVKIPTFVVAYSGGLDSHVLLHLAYRYCQGRVDSKIRAVHINHQLHVDSAEWAEHCVSVCSNLQIPCEVIPVGVQKQVGSSLEALAREARYQALGKELGEGEQLLLAQHQNDQAETFMLQLLRGAGVKGLACMPEKKSFRQGRIVRPLLKELQRDLVEYAKQYNLVWVEDPSNQDIMFDRNYIRQELLPRIEKRWPSCAKSMARSAHHCAMSDQLLTELAEEDYKKTGSVVSSVLPIEYLIKLSSARRYNLLRYWTRLNVSVLPDTKQLEEMNRIISSQDDAMPCLHFKGVEVRKYDRQLYIMPKLARHDVDQVISWDLLGDLVLPNNLGVLRSDLIRSSSHIDCEGKKITVRFRCGGEKIKLPGHQVRHSLKKLFQQWKVPTWQRDRVPLLFADDELIMVVGYSC